MKLTTKGKRLNCTTCKDRERAAFSSSVHLMDATVTSTRGAYSAVQEAAGKAWHSPPHGVLQRYPPESHPSRQSCGVLHGNHTNSLTGDNRRAGRAVVLQYDSIQQCFFLPLIENFNLKHTNNPVASRESRQRTRVCKLIHSTIYLPNKTRHEGLNSGLAYCSSKHKKRKKEQKRGR